MRKIFLSAVFFPLLFSACALDLQDALKGAVQRTAADKMLAWMTNNRHPATCLPYSHVGDPALTNFIILYDAAVSSMAYARMGSTDDAKRIIDFYRTNTTVKRLGGFIEVFKLDPSFAGIDWAVRMGANLWLGLSAFHLYRKTGMPIYLDLAKQQADLAITWQVTNSGLSNYGGVPLGPAGDTNYPGDQHIGYDPGLPSYTNIFATEIQIDAYALNTMLFKETGLVKYSNAAVLLTNWLKQYAHNTNQGRFNRGYNDAVITTDVHSWGVSALGVNLLDTFETNLAAKMLAFAESNCVSPVTFLKPGGSSVSITGADFIDKTYASALGRGPLVSPEWTFELISAYGRMAYDLQKAGRTAEASGYEARKDFLISEMLRLAIDVNDTLAYPYATLGNVPIGNENNTPSDGNLSVIGAAYGILVLTGFDPLYLPE